MEDHREQSNWQGSHDQFRQAENLYRNALKNRLSASEIELARRDLEEAQAACHKISRDLEKERLAEGEKHPLT